MGDKFQRRRARVYVAGPISSDPMEGVHRATAISRQMFLDGLAPFVPHWDAMWFLGEGHWKAYLEFDLEFVSVCDAVYRLSGESKGADKEVAVARELGINVYYESCKLGGGQLCPPFCNGGYSELLYYMGILKLTGVHK